MVTLVLHCASHPLQLSYSHGSERRTEALPVHYVFPRQKMDVDEAVGSLLKISRSELVGVGAKKGVILVWDVSLDHLAGENVTGFPNRMLIERY